MDGNVEKNMTIYSLRGKIDALPMVDSTLSRKGRAADAKATGEEFKKLNERFDDIDPHSAENVEYDNEASGITAETVQAALDWMVANYLRLEGGNLACDLGIEKESPAMNLLNTSANRSGAMLYSNSSNLILSNKQDDDNLVGIWVKPETEAPKDYLDLGRYVDGEFTRYAIFGEYNKPSGTYVGTGDSTTVTIDTKGIGDVVMVNSGNGFAFVTPRGAVCIAGTDVHGLVSGNAKFSDGVLTLNTTDSTLNKASGNYYWQVL